MHSSSEGSHLSPRHAIILGASGGLGRAVCERLAGERYALALAGRSLQRLEQVRLSLANSIGPELKAESYQVDLEDPTSIASFASTLGRKHPDASVLVNCAAGFFKGQFSEIDYDALAKLIDSNYRGVVLLIRALLPLLQRNTPADIVNITSVSASTTLDASRSSSAHIATKAALHSFDVALGREVAGLGVRITTVAPDTFAKEGREGLALADVAEVIFRIITLPPSMRMETAVLHKTGWKRV